jgi:uncharacterized protein (TIGR02145 family)
MAAVALMLAVSSNPVQAQLGGALKSVKNAAEATVKSGADNAKEAAAATQQTATQQAEQLSEDPAVQQAAEQAESPTIASASPAAAQTKGGLTDSKTYPADTDEGVVINGVRWATRNVGEPGKFAAKPSDAGMMYKWNSNKPVPATGDVQWDDSAPPAGEKWTNSPCPAGWRPPTMDEAKKLFDNKKVSSAWTTMNGVAGRTYTDIATGATMFVPATGWRLNGEGKLAQDGKRAWNWTGTEHSKEAAWHWGFDNLNDFEWRGGVDRKCAEAIRAVKN